MSQSIDQALVEHVAELASLSLTEAERAKLTAELQTIVAYVRELDSLDTSNVAPTAQIVASAAPSPLRPDDVRPCLSHDDALAAAPRTSEGGFVVPAFVEAGATHRKDAP
jgi:aspartyl-tRNA(Asn)/glutamyl-tRNA(Gln) amidotransferase subunit C